jgi:hypothetical protein
MNTRELWEIVRKAWAPPKRVCVRCNLPYDHMIHTDWRLVSFHEPNEDVKPDDYVMFANKDDSPPPRCKKCGEPCQMTALLDKPGIGWWCPCNLKVSP